MPTKLQALLELLELQWQKGSYSHEEEKRRQVEIHVLSLYLVICF